MEACLIGCINSSLKPYMYRNAAFLSEALRFKDFSKSGSYHRRCLSQSFSNQNYEGDAQAPEKLILERSSEIGDSCKRTFDKFMIDSKIPEKATSSELTTTKFTNWDAIVQEAELLEKRELRETDMNVAEACNEDAKFNKRLCENEKFAVEGKQALSVPFMANSSSVSQHQRAKPRNPRINIGKSTLADVAKKLEDKMTQKLEVSRSDLLFTAEEKALLKNSRPDLSKINSEKWPLLHILATSGQEFYLDKFLKQGADVNVIDKDGYSAVQRAILAKKKTAVNLLLGAGADVTVCDKDGASLLHYSVQTGSTSLVTLFINRGVDVNSADKYGWTPLHLAVLSGRADIVRLLLVNGADKTLSNKDGFTPLDLSLTLGKGFNSCEVAKGLKRLPRKQASIGM